MRKINKWVARDGSEFSTEEKAMARENLLDKVDSIYNEIPTRPHDTNFSNGDGYIQHRQAKILSSRSRLIELAKEYVFSEISSYDIHSYAFGRYLDDNNDILYRLYNRIVSCIDDHTWREYGQPYYAVHPDQAKQFQING